jgi:hypothetical protein
VIVTTPADPSRTLGGGGGDVAWRCLVRRGMLHSECEAIDLVRLPPGAVFAPAGTEGVESAWFVVAGGGTVDGVGPARTGDVVLVPARCPVRLDAGPDGLDLVWIAVLPADVSRALPPRVPVAS